MPAYTGGRLVALLERYPGKVHLMIGNAGRIVMCFREWSQKGWRYCPLGLYSQGNGYWVRYANADTDLDLTEWHDDIHGIWVDAGEVPNGAAVMEQAAKVWAKHYKNEEGTTASQHFLADVFAQAAVKENGDIKLGLKWVMDYVRRIFALETVFGGKLMLCNEKVHATCALRRVPSYFPPVTGLLLGDDIEVVEGCKVFVGDKNEIKPQGGVDVSFGSRIQQTGGFYEYFRAKKHIMVIIELSRTFTGKIYFDMVACDAPTLLHLLNSGMLWSHGKDVKDETLNPLYTNDWCNRGKEPGDEDWIHRFGRPLTDKVIRVDGKLMQRDINGVYRANIRPKTATDLHVNDFIACAKTERFPGCVLVEDAKPETAMAALLSVSALGGGAQPCSHHRLRFDTTRACRDARTMAQCREGLRATSRPISDENGLD